MKKKKILLLFIFVINMSILYAQQAVHVELEGRSLGELIETVEKQTGYHVFCLPESLDTIVVSVRAEGKDPVDVIRQALQNTGCQVSVYEQFVFITKGRELITQLPPGFLGKTEVAEQIVEKEETPVVIPEIEIPEEKQAPRMPSEQRVYEIGNPNLPAKARVTISGYVTNFKTGEPLPGISLYLENTTTGTSTDAYGFYSLQLPRGRQELRIRGIGMVESKRQLMLHSDGRLNIEMQERVYSISEVVVRADRIDHVRSTSIGVERLRMAEIKNVPTVFGEKDILRIVMSLPGVKSVGEISSGFNVRGGATDQNLVLYNDGTVYNPTHMFGLFSAFNPDVVKDIELYKSSIPPKYGGRISSVLDISNREGNRKKFQGSASIGLLTGSLSVEGPLLSERTSYLIGVRTTYSDWLLRQLPERNTYHKGNAGFHDLSATISHKAGERDNILLNGYYSKDRFAFTGEEDYAYHNANVSVKWRHQFSPAFISIFTAGYDHYDYQINNRVDTITAYKLDFGIDQQFGKIDFSLYPHDNHQIGFGLSTIHYNYTPGNYLPNHENSLVAVDRMQHEKALESAVYIGDEWKITPALSANAGIRYSIFNVLGPRSYNTYAQGALPVVENILSTESAEGILKTYHGPEYRISARYAFSDNMSVKACFNTMRQYIHMISNNTIMSPTDIWKLSDMHILPQSGIQMAAGLFRNLKDNMFETSLELYYKTMDHYLDYRPGAELVMNHHIETELVETEGRSYGVELMVKKIRGKLNGWASYTYSRTMLRQTDPRIVLPVNFGDWYPADFDKPHEFKFVGNYKFTQRYSVSMNCDYSTGRPITIPVAKYKYVGGEYVYYTERNKLRVPDFFRIDLSFNVEPSHHLTLLTHSSFSFGVYNLTGRHNAYSIYYVLDYRQIKGYKLAIFGMPIPYVSYNIKF